MDTSTRKTFSTSRIAVRIVAFIVSPVPFSLNRPPSSQRYHHPRRREYCALPSIHLFIHPSILTGASIPYGNHCMHFYAPLLLHARSRLSLCCCRRLPTQDSVSVENALYADPRVHEAAAVGVPDERLGELVAAVVSVKPSYRASVTEGTLMAAVRTR